MTTRLTDDLLQKTMRIFIESNMNQRVAARTLGIARSTLQDRLAAATIKGIGPHFANPDALPEGLMLNGTTTLYSDEGGVKLQWVKTKGLPLDIVINLINQAFGEYDKGKIEEKMAKVAKIKNSALHTIYPIADLHVGMYSWREETGASYDIKIAAKVLTDSFTMLMAHSPNSDVGVVLNLGDFFHSDNDEQRTRRSGAKLDVDTRYARVQREGLSLLRRIVDMAKTKHKFVLLKNIPGNHDPYGSLALTNALAMHYEDDKQVIVDVEADPVWVYTFGKVLVAAAHGDMLGPAEFSANVAANHGEEWGGAEWRYGYMGHIHQRKVFEKGGMEVEVFRTLAPKDSWSTAKGFTARRSLVSLTHDHIRGQIESKIVNVRSRD